MVAACGCLPWLQVALGIVPFAGQAWMASLYLWGLACAIWMGYHWERAAPNQLSNTLFVAILVSAVVSVWLQLSTWLDLWSGGFLEIWWSMTLTGDRPYANFGQPNLLATFLVWGLLACLWFYIGGHFRGGTAVLLAAYLLIGIALTQSRMATLVLASGLLATCWWRSLWPSPRMPWVCLGLFAFFLLCPVLLGWLQVVLDVGPERDFQRLGAWAGTRELRVAAWRTFALAVLERPWLGYGWKELVEAQLAVADRLPPLRVAFAHTHNLVLDLLAWCGIPMGLAIVGALLCWSWRTARSVRCAKGAVLLMVVAAIGIHAMLEFPLHYAHFLLPVGMLAGILDARRGVRVAWTGPRWISGLVLLAVAAMLAAVIRDYLRVEQAYTVLRFEQQRIGSAHLHPAQPPDVLVLTQMREWFRFARDDVRSGMDDEEMARSMHVASTFPTTAAFLRVATMLAVNGRPEEAGHWLGKICPLIDEQSCTAVESLWKERALSDARLQEVAWPTP
ncbi:hypothetical protein ASF43_21100 [Pseudorhodoferax sp. Leaf267]|nr:hypothetical protein ASF43_21100 [Pseudorhodoferax sp. Leaf267]